MLKQHRGILMILLLGCLGGISAVGYLLLRPLPHPRDATRAELLQWMVLRDVAAESPEIQTALAERLDAEVARGLDVSDEVSTLSDAMRERLEVNSSIVKKAWFLWRVDGYFETPEAGRKDYLDQRIAGIVLWTKLEKSVRESAGQPVPANKPTFFDEIDGWVAETQGEQQQRMRAAIRHGFIRWLATQDISHLSDQSLRRLADSVARDLDAPREERSEQFVFNPAEQAQLKSNGQSLLHAWLVNRSLEYAALDEPRRGAYLNELLDRVTKRKIDPQLLGAKPGNSSLTGQMALLPVLMSAAQAKEHDGPQVRGAINRFVADFSAAWFKRSLRV